MGVDIGDEGTRAMAPTADARRYGVLNNTNAGDIPYYTHTTERMVDAAMVAAPNALDEALDKAIGPPTASPVEENDGSDSRTAEGEGV